MSSDPQATRIPVTLLTGFLGSGKTTLLNRLLQDPMLADALVIINEFGETALDHLLVAHSTERLMVEMSNGCLCCGTRGDLVKTLRDATWRFSRNGQRQFQRMLIETTGLSDPAPILHTLATHPQVAPKYRLDGVVTTLDLATGPEILDRHTEAAQQVAWADCLLLTKPDLASEDQRQAMSRRLDQLNPTVPRREVRHGEIDPRLLLDLVPGRRFITAPGIGHRSHDTPSEAYSFSMPTPLPGAALESWARELTTALGPHGLLRLKGIVHLCGHDQPFALHGVRQTLYPLRPLPAWPTEDRHSRLVFITQNLDRALIEAALPSLRSATAHAEEPIS